jgi:hypothetical protein
MEKTVERKHIKIFEEVTCKTNNSVKHEEQMPLIPGLMESILKMEYHGN